MRFFSLPLEHRFLERRITEAKKGGFGEIDTELRRAKMADLEQWTTHQVAKVMTLYGVVDPSILHLAPIALILGSLDAQKKLEIADSTLCTLETKHAKFIEKIETAIVNTAQAIIHTADKLKTPDHQLAQTFSVFRTDCYHAGIGNFFDHVAQKYPFIQLWIHYKEPKNTKENS